MIGVRRNVFLSSPGDYIPQFYAKSLAGRIVEGKILTDTPSNSSQYFRRLACTF